MGIEIIKQYNKLGGSLKLPFLGASSHDIRQKIYRNYKQLFLEKNNKINQNQEDPIQLTTLFFAIPVVSFYITHKGSKIAKFNPLRLTTELPLRVLYLSIKTICTLGLSQLPRKYVSPTLKQYCVEDYPGAEKLFPIRTSDDDEIEQPLDEDTLNKINKSYNDFITKNIEDNHKARRSGIINRIIRSIPYFPVAAVILPAIFLTKHINNVVESPIRYVAAPIYNKTKSIYQSIRNKILPYKTYRLYCDTSYLYRHSYSSESFLKAIKNIRANRSAMPFDSELVNIICNFSTTCRNDNLYYHRAIDRIFANHRFGFGFNYRKMLLTEKRQGLFELAKLNDPSINSHLIKDKSFIFEFSEYLSHLKVNELKEEMSNVSGELLAKIFPPEMFIKNELTQDSTEQLKTLLFNDTFKNIFLVQLGKYERSITLFNRQKKTKMIESFKDMITSVSDGKCQTTIIVMNNLKNRRVVILPIVADDVTILSSFETAKEEDTESTVSSLDNHGDRSPKSSRRGSVGIEVIEEFPSCVTARFGAVI